MKNNKPFFQLGDTTRNAHHDEFSGKWWSTCFPLYTAALSFLAIGTNGNNKKDNSSQLNFKRECFELNSLLQACCKASSIPEPAQLNHLEEAGSYMTYLSKLTRQSNDNGHS